MSKELINKTEKELNKSLLKDREEVRKFRFSISGAGKKDLKEIRRCKKEIAQILTELKSRKINNN